MKAKVVHKSDASGVPFSRLESGDWFLFHGRLHVKSDFIGDSDAIDFDDDMDPIAVTMEDDDEIVTPIQVTITY